MKSTDTYNDAAVEVFEQDPAGFSIGDAVFFNDQGEWELADPASEDSLADGLVVMARFGFIHVWSASEAIRIHNHGLGQPGDRLYLDDSTPGGITTVKPSTGLVQLLGKVLSNDRILWSPRLAADASLMA